MTATNATVWREHEGLLIPDEVVPWTREELDEQLVRTGSDPYTVELDELSRDWWLAEHRRISWGLR